MVHRNMYDFHNEGDKWNLTSVLMNTLRPRQNGRHFADNKNISILIQISLKFVRKGRMNKMTALVLIMHWHRTDDKPLSEPMLV